MRLETFSYLPELDALEVRAQVEWILARGTVVAIEHTERPDPYAHYWTLWRLPLFDVRDAETVLGAVEECRRAHPDSYVRLNGYDPVRQGQVSSFVVQRPEEGA